MSVGVFRTLDIYRKAKSTFLPYATFTASPWNYLNYVHGFNVTSTSIGGSTFFVASYSSRSPRRTTVRSEIPTLIHARPSGC